MKKIMIPLACVLVITGCTNQAYNKSDYNQLVADNTAYESQINTLTAEKESLESALNDSRSTIKNLEATIEDLNSQINEGPLEEPVNEIDSSTAKDLMITTDKEVIKALANKNFKTLSEYVHPVMGLRLTPYSYVDLTKDVVLTRRNLADDNLLKLEKTWGEFDGSGEPISMSFADYYDLFIYPADYENADDITYNVPHPTGNSIDNHKEFYGDCITVDYHFDGFNPDYAGMDWRTLRLIYVKYGEQYYLVGIINNQWTI